MITQQPHGQKLAGPISGTLSKAEPLEFVANFGQIDHTFDYGRRPASDQPLLEEFVVKISNRGWNLLRPAANIGYDIGALIARELDRS